MSSLAAKRFFEEMVALLDKQVVVVTKEGKYQGLFLGFDPATLTLCLSDVKDKDGKPIHKLFINGNTITQIFTTEKPFNIRKLAERLDRVFPKLVKIYDEAGVVVVMDKIRVNQDGIIEGKGPAADRVKKVYDEFIKQSQ